MKIRHPWQDGLRSAGLVVLMLILWGVFAPVATGGAASYVIVAGASMEPVLHRGDLVIARTEGEYGVGDIVTYRHPVVGPVIHRIIGRTGNRFVLKGDANTWVDSYHPRLDDIVGAAWLRLPGFGGIIQWLRHPIVMASLALLISLLMVSAMATETAQHGESFGRRLWTRMRDAMQDAGLLQGAVFVLGLVGIISLLLCLAAFTHPITKKVDRGITYQNRGRFSYTARVSDRVYGAESLQTGQPVFLNLTRQVSFRFDYNLIADELTEAHGTVSLVARVMDSNGWSRSVILQPETPFTGSKASMGGELNLNSLLAYIRDLDQMTGVRRPAFTVSIEPVIHVFGTVSGAALEDRFSPSLTFTLDELQMQMARPEPGATDADPIQPSADGSIPATELVANRLSVLGLSLDVAQARWGGAVGLVLSIVFAVLLWLAFQRAQQEDVAGSIRMRYGQRIVAVRSRDLGIRKRVVDVSDIEDLARVADRSGHMILWLHTDAGHEYYVRDGDDTYRFTHPVESIGGKDLSRKPMSDPATPSRRV